MNFTDNRFNKLFPEGHSMHCTDLDCQKRTVEIDGSWYITGGHAGFNSPANNGSGYPTKSMAAGVSTRYQRRGEKARAEAKSRTATLISGYSTSTSTKG